MSPLTGMVGYGGGGTGLGLAGGGVPAALWGDTAWVSGDCDTGNTNNDKYNIPTTGNATDFGSDDGFLSDEKQAASNGSRLIIGGYRLANDSRAAVIQYKDFANTSNTADFGDLSNPRFGVSTMVGDSHTRAVFAGGDGGSNGDNKIEYVTMDTLGDAATFGTCVGNRPRSKGVSNDTRGVYGWAQYYPDALDYITIATTGNGTDFGDSWNQAYAKQVCMNETRGCASGHYNGGTDIEYITIASTGNAADFGDLTQGRGYGGGCSNGSRGVFNGGVGGGSYRNEIDYIDISSTGNATDFGDLTAARYAIAAAAGTA